jgi:hypothetical protein
VGKYRVLAIDLDVPAELLEKAEETLEEMIDELGLESPLWVRTDLLDVLCHVRKALDYIDIMAVEE